MIFRWQHGFPNVTDTKLKIHDDNTENQNSNRERSNALPKHTPEKKKLK